MSQEMYDSLVKKIQEYYWEQMSHDAWFNRNTGSEADPTHFELVNDDESLLQYINEWQTRISEVFGFDPGEPPLEILAEWVFYQIRGMPIEEIAGIAEKMQEN